MSSIAIVLFTKTDLPSVAGLLHTHQTDHKIIDLYLRRAGTFDVIIALRRLAGQLHATAMTMIDRWQSARHECLDNCLVDNCFDLISVRIGSRLSIDRVVLVCHRLCLNVVHEEWIGAIRVVTRIAFVAEHIGRCGGR